MLPRHSSGQAESQEVIFLAWALPNYTKSLKRTFNYV